VLGLDLSEAGRAADARLTSQLRELLAEKLVLLFRGQAFETGGLLLATQLFGDVAVRDVWSRDQQSYKYPDPDQPSLRIMTETQPSSTAVRWHVDAPFLPTTIDFLILHAVETAPTVAPTQFLDMRGAFADLSPGDRARFRDLSVVFSSTPSLDVRVESYDRRPTSAETSFTRPLVYRHPVTGEESFQIAMGRRHRIEGLSESKSEELIADIYASASRDHCFLSHAWATGDVLIWDNYSTNHRQGPPGHGRRLIHKFHGCWAAT
jgi:alpha-ketoglutarate-dependent taurine dioxygenase